MCTLVLSLEKYLYTDFKYKDVRRLSAEFCWCGDGCTEKYSPNTLSKNTGKILSSPYGLGLHKAGSAQLPCAPCACTLTALMFMSHFSQLPTQATQPAAKIPDILQGMAEFYKPRAGRATKLLCCIHCRMNNVLTG